MGARFTGWLLALCLAVVVTARPCALMTLGAAGSGHECCETDRDEESRCRVLCGVVGGAFVVADAVSVERPLDVGAVELVSADLLADAGVFEIPVRVFRPPDLLQPLFVLHSSLLI